MPCTSHEGKTRTTFLYCLSWEIYIRFGHDFKNATQFLNFLLRWTVVFSVFECADTEQILEWQVLREINF